MTLRLILPKTLVDPADYADVPLYFLAGPILGAGAWQDIFCQLLLEREKECALAVPCRWGASHHLLDYALMGEEGQFKRQRAWERHYMRRAAHSGGIIFWFGSESKESPRNDGNPYGMDTRGEISEWGARASYDSSVRLFIGCENAGDGFKGWSRIEYDLREEDMLGSDFPLYPRLEALADAVAQD